jgi:hypothetical protein
MHHPYILGVMINEINNLILTTRNDWDIPNKRLFIGQTRKLIIIIHGIPKT